MIDEELREIIQETVKEVLRQRQVDFADYPTILRRIDNEMYLFFRGVNNKGIEKALRKLASDPYIDIILLQYRDGVSMANIAECMEKDISTIKRQKKRLIQIIYSYLE